jgi:hypothetical protein
MQREIAVHTKEGSLVAQSALAGLARNLDINESALKVALSRAYDLLPQVGHNPMLALHLSFSNMDHVIDAGRLSMVIGALRGVYGASLAAEQGKGYGDYVEDLLTKYVDTTPRVPAAQMYPSSYRELPGADVSRDVPTAQMNRNPYRVLLPKAPISAMNGADSGHAHATHDSSMGPPMYPASASRSADSSHGMCSASYQTRTYSQLSESNTEYREGASARGHHLAALPGEPVYHHHRLPEQVKEKPEYLPSGFDRVQYQ